MQSPMANGGQFAYAVLHNAFRFRFGTFRRTIVMALTRWQPLPLPAPVTACAAADFAGAGARLAPDKA